MTQQQIEFELVLEQYRLVLSRLKRKAIRKYGSRAAKWFSKDTP